MKQRCKWRETRHRCLALGLIGLWLMPIIAMGAAVPDMVPMPKVYQPTGGWFELNGKPIMIAKANRQCQIAADEIALRIKEFGGESGAIEEAADGNKGGIFILPVTHAVAAQLVKELKLKVTPDDPGPQGYVIQAAGDRLVVIGSDAIGALYGAMTLRQMMIKGENGKVGLANARVDDKPDYRYRGKVDAARCFRGWSTWETNRLAVCKAGIDWMLRFKLNVLDDYTDLQPAMRGKAPDEQKLIAAMNAYAIERGVFPLFWDNTRIGIGTYDKDRPEFQHWDCIHTAGKGERYWCWSRDDLALEYINRAIDFCKACHFKILFVHPVDGGGAYDPERWSQRCDRCKKQFGDDRWKASVHQFNLWAKVIKEKAPDLIFSIPIYLYSAQYGDYDYVRSISDRRGLTGFKREIWQKNTIDYWTKTGAGMDPMIIPAIWPGLPVDVERYRQCFPGRPLTLYAHSIAPLGYFGTWHRLAKTNYSGNPLDIFYLAAGNYGSHALWLNQICTGEFTWNTAAPGSEVFKGTYYDAENDHIKPQEIMDVWVPRACRAFFGEAVGDRIAPVYSAGVQPWYIQDPGGALARANKYRGDALADTDPDQENTAAPDTSATKRDSLPPIADSAERMALQVKATAKALTALESAYPYLDTLDKYRRKTFMYFYKRMPLWRLLARARYALAQANDFEAMGKKAEACKVLDEALGQWAQDNAAAEKTLAMTSREPDLFTVGPLDKKSGDVEPTPERMKQLLQQRLDSLRITMKPRAVGATVKVGLYKGMGADGTRQYLERFQNVSAEIFDSLSLAVLDRYDCVFIFQTGSVIEHDYFSNLPRYVRDGGRGVLFQHAMCGFNKRCPFGERTPFPEVAPYADGRQDAKTLVVKEAHAAMPGLKAGEKMTHMYYDHITPKAGPAGKVVAADEAGNPVVIVGEAGKGKVIFDGNINITERNKDEPLTLFNAVLARGAVEWMTGSKLTEK